MLDGITKREAIEHAVRQGRSKTCHQIEPGTEEPVLDCRKVVLHHAPLRRECSRVPGIVDIAKIHLFVGRQDVIDPE